jgi:hypothetical protein
MTLDTYTDLFDDDLEAVATALDHRAMQTDGAELLPRAAERPLHRLRERETPPVGPGVSARDPSGI